jgi:ubiquinol-cytochrome c reductase cytochrome c subunit
MTGAASRTTRAAVLAVLFAVPLLALFAEGALGQGSPSPSPSSPSSSALVKRGRVAYEERCASCHGEDAGGGIQGAPSIVGLGPAYFDFVMSTGRMPLDQPDAQMKRRRPVLSPREIEAVTAFLVSLSEPGAGVAIPHVDAAAGGLPEGRELYTDNCAPCHATSGNGGAVGPEDAPDVHHATEVQVAEAVRIGPGTMPRFDETTLDQPRLNSLVRYVRFLRAPDDRGGASLSHVGPLIEGFVALGVGLGIVVLVTRWIGTRS